jgi:hypothetical protein
LLLKNYKILLVFLGLNDAETFYVVVEGQVVINGVEIIEALFLTYSQFYIFNIEYYQDNIATK